MPVCGEPWYGPSNKPHPLGKVWLGMYSLLVLFLLLASPQTSSIRGKVLDSRTLEPIAKATVSIRDRRIETHTAANGEFSLPDVAPGEIELYVTTVGYALARKRLTVTESTPIDVEILLGPEV